LQEAEFWKPSFFGAFSAHHGAAQMQADARIFRHHNDFVYSGCSKARENTQHDIGAISDLQASRVRDDAAYVSGRYRICDDANNGAVHAIPPASRHGKKQSSPSHRIRTMQPFNALGKPHQALRVPSPLRFEGTNEWRRTDLQFRAGKAEAKSASDPKVNAQAISPDWPLLALLARSGSRLKPQIPLTGIRALR
jgi:hypothetical protein